MKWLVKSSQDTKRACLDRQNQLQSRLETVILSAKWDFSSEFSYIMQMQQQYRSLWKKKKSTSTWEHSGYEWRWHSNIFPVHKSDEETSALVAKLPFNEAVREP